MGEKPAKHSWNPTHTTNKQKKNLFLYANYRTSPNLEWCSASSPWVYNYLWEGINVFSGIRCWKQLSLAAIQSHRFMCQQTSGRFYLCTNQGSVLRSLNVCYSHDRGYFPSKRYFPVFISRGFPPLTKLLWLFFRSRWHHKHIHTQQISESQKLVLWKSLFKMHLSSLTSNLICYP